VISHLVFDYGNTVIAYGPEQIAEDTARIASWLCAKFGTCNTKQLEALRFEQIMHPYNHGYRENNFYTICQQTIEHLCDIIPSHEQVAELMEIRTRAFLQAVRCEAQVLKTLTELKSNYSLSLLSNYPNAAAITRSLHSCGLTDVFDHVVISADIGYVKPHPAIYQALLKTINAPAQSCVMIGDNMLADIQGGKDCGMKTVYTTQYTAYHSFTSTKNDCTADATIASFSQLPEILSTL